MSIQGMALSGSRVLGLLIMLSISVPLHYGDTDKLSLSDLRVAVPFPEGSISVFTGKGKKVLKLKSVRGKGDDRSILRHAYFSPDVHPDHSSLVCLKCTDLPKDLPAPYEAKGCKVIRVALDSGEENLFYEPLPGRGIESPVFSPDGTRLALLSGKGIEILDTKSGRRLDRIEEVVRSVTDDSHGVDEYIRWDPTGTKIYILDQAIIDEWRGLGAKKVHKIRKPGPDGQEAYFDLETYEGYDIMDVVEVELATREIKRHDFQNLRFFYEKFEPYPTELGVPTTLPETPLVHALFGSSENPVLHPQRSPDGRYYFYYTFKDGFFANGWIEGYDLEESRTFRVQTLWWRPYSE